MILPVVVVILSAVAIVAASRRYPETVRPKVRIFVWCMLAQAFLYQFIVYASTDVGAATIRGGAMASMWIGAAVAILVIVSKQIKGLLATRRGETT